MLTLAGEKGVLEGASPEAEFYILSLTNTAWRGNGFDTLTMIILSAVAGWGAWEAKNKKRRLHKL